jgi:hypothetical protein
MTRQLTPYHGTDIETDLRWVAEEFGHIAGSVKRADLESLILRTTELHHRGTDVLNPDRSPNPVPSPFVRCMPKKQEEIEAKRYQRKGRHVAAYEVHILQALEHFVQA